MSDIPGTNLIVTDMAKQALGALLDAEMDAIIGENETVSTKSTNTQAEYFEQVSILARNNLRDEQRQRKAEVLYRLFGYKK